jgi:hypothetical protein
MEPQVSIKIPRRIVNSLAGNSCIVIRTALQLIGVDPNGLLLAVANQTLSHGDWIAVPDDNGGMVIWRCLTTMTTPCNEAYTIAVAGEHGHEGMLYSRQTRAARKITHHCDAEGNWHEMKPQLSAPAFNGDLADIIEFDRFTSLGQTATGEAFSLTREQLDVLEPMRAEALAKLGLVELPFLGFANAEESPMGLVA